MNPPTDRQPQHIAGCDRTEEFGPCAGCRWQQERGFEWDAWQRWLALFRWAPRGAWEGRGWG